MPQDVVTSAMNASIANMFIFAFIMLLFFLILQSRCLLNRQPIAELV